MFDENGEPITEDPWSSIVDLMSALVLVLFLTVIFFITNYSEVSEALVTEQKNLAAKSADLDKTRLNLISANKVNQDLITREQNLIAETKRLNDERAKLLGEKDKLTAETQRLNADRLALIADKKNLTAETERLNADRSSLMADKSKLTAETERLNADRTLLINDKSKLTGDKDKLTSETETLKADKAALERARMKIEQRAKRLEQRADRLEQEQAQLIKDRQKLIQERMRLINDKDNLSSETERLNAQVLKLQAALKEAAERQASFMSSLASSFKKAKAQGVSVDREGGKIILKSEVLFSKGRSTLTDAGRISLRQVSQGLVKVLTDPKMRPIVEGVMIEGHTSSSGQYKRNLRLSANRSLNTLDYLLSLSGIKNTRLQSLFFAGAFGESRPVKNSRGREDKIKSRRIEIRVLFNQSHVKSLTHDISK